MTGAFLRVQREGRWIPVEIEFLTDEERLEKFKGRDVEEVIRWMNLVCNKLAELDPLLKELADEGIIRVKEY